MEYLNISVHIILIMSLGWYLITNLQWYNYKLDRVIFKHHKWQWHITYFVSPIVLFYIIPEIYFPAYFVIYFISFILWNKKLSNPLVLTARVKRFLAILLIITFSIVGTCIALEESCISKFIFVPLILTYIISTVLEKIFFIRFKNRAKQRYKSISGLRTVAITASFGKTSIKNFLYHILKHRYKVYKTPRSVNTLAGIVLDVNRSLPNDTQIYIAEAGARQTGDIEDITMFLEPQICVIGSVGEQHIEYFKTLDNIIKTKMEILKSPRMQIGFVHDSVPINEYPKITKFPNNLKIISSTLDGIKFSVIIEGRTEEFFAPILGSFNAINLTAVILVAYSLGMSILEIKAALTTIPQVEHRLQKIEAGGKIILDDSFNGNLEGMLEAINIASTHTGRRVIITPGLVESTVQANILLAKEINRVFDFVIITGNLNLNALKSNIDKEKVFILKDKSQMQDILAKTTYSGDLILFANDAPNFI